MSERLFIDNILIPIENTLNPSLTKSIKDIQELEKTATDSTKTIKLPRSKEADGVFDHVWDHNITNPTFDVSLKLPCKYEAGGITLIDGFCQLKDVTQIQGEDFTYSIVIFGQTASFRAEIKDKYLNEIDLSLWNHPFSAEIQEFSWATDVYYDGGLIPFAYGNGYVYPIVDYGMTSDLTDWYFKNLPCCFYLKTIIDGMFSDAGFTYSSAFFDSDDFKRMIIPSSPSNFNLTSSEIADITFTANVPQFTSTGTVTTGNLPKTSYSAIDTLIFTNEVADAGGNYNPATGIYTCTTAGAMMFTATINLSADFTPDDGVTSLTQTSEIRGFLRIIFNDGGGDVIKEAIEVVITKDQTSGPTYTVGTRSTAASPTYPNSDYEKNITWSLVGSVANPVSREVNPPNRYKMTWSNGNIQVGDTIRVVWTGQYRESVDSTQTYFEDAGGLPYDGEATLTMESGAFYSTMVNNELAEGSTVNVSKLLSDKIKQWDFFKGVINLFNLYIEPDPNNPLNLTIEPVDDYHTLDEQNIHELIDSDKTAKLKPIGLQNFKEILYTYKQDKDYLNEKYQDAHQKVYGEREIISLNEFNQKKSKTEVIFSPTPCAAPPGSNFVIPTIIDINEDGTSKTLQHNIRILYYGGLKDTEEVWNLQGDFIYETPENYVQYPYAGMWDDPYNPTYSLCFGNEKEIYYDASGGVIEQTNNNLFNNYHLKQVLQITDKNSQLLENWVDLNYRNYSEFTFDKLYFFNESYWRLQEIKGFNPSVQDTTKCVWLKYINIGDFQIGTIPLDDTHGETDPLFPGGGGGVPTIDAVEYSSVFGGKAPMQSDGNAYYGKTVEVDGKDNYVSSAAKWVTITGDGNQVFSGATNIELINSHDNIIDAGVSNVTLIGTSGVTIQESDVCFICGQQVGGLGVTRFTDRSETLDPAFKVYEVTPSPTDATITIDESLLTEGHIVHIKKMNQARKVIIAGTTGTVDDQTSITIKQKYDSITLYFDGINTIII